MATRILDWCASQPTPISSSAIAHSSGSIQVADRRRGHRDDGCLTSRAAVPRCYRVAGTRCERDALRDGGDVREVTYAPIASAARFACSCSRMCLSSDGRPRSPSHPPSPRLPSHVSLPTPPLPSLPPHPRSLFVRISKENFEKFISVAPQVWRPPSEAPGLRLSNIAPP